MSRRWLGRLPWLVLLVAAAPVAGAAPLRVVCSFYPVYVMALNVTGDLPGVTVECMTGPVIGCLHDYQLTAADLKTLATADVFIANGAGMETFLDKALQQAPRVQFIEAARGIRLAFPGNPHVWLSLDGAIQETKNIAAGLAAADPARSAAYAQNAAAYVARLAALRRQMHAALDGLPHRDIITFHEAFPYFAAEFNLHIVGVVEREPGSEPSAAELARLITTVRQTGVKALFVEPQYPAKSAAVIHDETGVAVRELDPAVTGPRDPARARDSYVRAMQQNLAVLVTALQD